MKYLIYLKLKLSYLSIEPPQRLRVVSWSNYLVSWTRTWSTFFYCIDWLINHTIEVIFVAVFKFVVVKRWGLVVALGRNNELWSWRGRCHWLSIKVIDNPLLFYTLFSDEIHLLLRNRHAWLFLMCINYHKLMTIDFREIVSGSQRLVYWNQSLSSLSYYDCIPYARFVMDLSMRNRGWHGIALLLAGHIGSVMEYDLGALRYSSKDRRACQFDGGGYDPLGGSTPDS